MNNLENRNGKEAQEKRPYNLREKKKKVAAYRNLIRPQLADDLYKRIIDIVVKQKKYRSADYSAKDLAKELNINTRYLSAVINSRFGENYSCLHNKYRIKESMPGMLCNVEMVSNDTPCVIVIPVNCIQLFENNKQYVWIINKRRTYLRQVTVGHFIQNGVTIRSGLNVGDRIVTEGFQKIGEGCEVTYK